MRWTPARDLDLVTNLGTHKCAPRTSDAYPTRISRAHHPSPASSTRTGSITAARTATRARVTPSSTTSRTSPFATVRQSAERGVGTRTGCGQRRSEEIGGTRWGDVSTGYFIYELYQIRSCSQNTDVFARPSASRVHDHLFTLGTRGFRTRTYHEPPKRSLRTDARKHL